MITFSISILLTPLTFVFFCLCCIFFYVNMSIRCLQVLVFISFFCSGTTAISSLATNTVSKSFIGWSISSLSLHLTASSNVTMFFTGSIVFNFYGFFFCYFLYSILKTWKIGLIILIKIKFTFFYELKNQGLHNFEAMILLVPGWSSLSLLKMIKSSNIQNILRMNMKTMNHENCLIIQKK